MTFSEQILYAISKPGRYGEMIKLTKGRSKLYVLVICLVLGIITFAVPVGALIASFGGFEKLFDKQLATLRYEDDQLKLDTKFSMKIEDATILINTDTASGKDETVKRDGMYLTVGSHRAVLLYTLSGKSYEYQSIALNTFLANGFNVSSLKNGIPFIYGYLVLMFVFTCAGFFVKYAICALFLVLCIKKYIEMREIKMSFGQMFMLCFYGESLGILISNCNAALGLLPQFIVSLVSVFISVRMIASAVEKLDGV